MSEITKAEMELMEVRVALGFGEKSATDNGKIMYKLIRVWGSFITVTLW